MAAVTLVAIMAWAMKVGGGLGEIVEGDEELEQAMRVALGTQLGSVAGRPLYGLDRLELVDEPVTTLEPKATRLVRRCFELSLPRHRFVRLALAGVDEQGRALLAVTWTAQTTDTQRTSEVTLG